MISKAILHWIIYYSSFYGIDPMLTKAIILNESNGNANAIGDKGEIGLMQLSPDYFYGNLFDPRTNIKLGVRYLSKVKKECKYKADNTFINCFNLGVEGGSKLKHPKSWPYYINTMKLYREMR